MNKILCPVDFSSASLNAIEYAVQLALKNRSSLSLFHVFTESDFSKIVGEEALGKTYGEQLDICKSKLKNIADTINDTYKGKGLVSCDYYIESGELSGQMLSFAEEEQYTLIVMGTTGVSRISGGFFGSNTEDVIDKSKIPVFCVPEAAVYHGFDKIVYATDFMREDRLIIQEVISFATVFNARISVVHIDTTDDEEEYEAYVAELKSFFRYDKISFTNKSFKENISLGIQEFLEEEKSDVLVVYKRQLGFFKSLFHKSLTKALSQVIDTPLFVLKT